MGQLMLLVGDRPRSSSGVRVGTRAGTGTARGHHRRVRTGPMPLGMTLLAVPCFGPPSRSSPTGRASTSAAWWRSSASRDSRDRVLDDDLDLAALDLVAQGRADLPELSGVRRRSGLHQGEGDLDLAPLVLDSLEP